MTDNAAMRVPRLYSADLKLGLVCLDPAESHHAVHVLRLRQNATVTVFDGAGGEGSGTVTRTGRDRVEIEVGRLSAKDYDVPFHLTLAVAMGKGNRQGYMIEKCTELGVAKIIPTITQRSVVKPNDAAIDRYRRRAIEAAKQSNRAWIPAISHPMPFAQVVRACPTETASYMADTGDNLQKLPDARKQETMDTQVLALVGPEGGWTDDERALALKSGFELVSLAPTTLRTETAAVAVCAQVLVLLDS